MLVVGPTPGRRRFELQEEAFVAHLTPSSDDRGLRARVVVPVGREVPRIAHKNVEMQPQQTRRSDHHRQDRSHGRLRRRAGDGEHVRRLRSVVGRSASQNTGRASGSRRGHNLVTHFPKLANSGRQRPNSPVLETPNSWAF